MRPSWVQILSQSHLFVGNRLHSASLTFPWVPKCRFKPDSHEHVAPKPTRAWGLTRWHYPISSPSINLRMVHELWHTVWLPSLTWPLKMLSWNPPRSSGVLRTSFPGLLAWCRAKKVLHFPSPQPSVSRLALLHVGKWTQVWLGNMYNILYIIS